MLHLTDPTQRASIAQFFEREAPRYTSYPSAHHFMGLEASSYAQWLAGMDPAKPIALYIHIPFCEQMCWFCGCNTKMTKRYEPVADYLDTLLMEFALLGQHLAFKPKVHSVHFGGGSPTILSPKDMTRVFYAIDSVFERLPHAEVAIEIDPRRLTAEKLACYRALGFNRASLGVQDTDPTVQKAIGRDQPFEVSLKAVQDLRAAGIDSIGIDLVYGLPHQTPETIAQTLAHVRELNPDRIACFSYAHVPWVKKHQQLIPIEGLPDPVTKAEYFLTISETLLAMGYEAIGMDHFAKPEDEMAVSLKQGTLRRNFMGYSTLPTDEMIGVGASSIGEMSEGIAQNITMPTHYKQAIREGKLPTHRGWTYGGEDKLRKAVISALMCYERVDVAEVATQFGYEAGHFDAELLRLAEYEAAGLVTVTGRVVEFHSPLKMLVRAVCTVFDVYASAPTKEKRYSKVS